MAQVSPTADSVAHSGPGLWERLKRDKPWWLLPLTVILVLGGFSVYGTWTAVFGGLSDCATANAIPGSPACGPYLSPFWSPRVPGWGPISGAVFILPIPLFFRATCYYYRKAYYRSFFWDPPACAVGELRSHTYHGEHRFPLILNNLHRFFMYAVTVVLIFLWVDAIQAFHYDGRWWIGVGTVIMAVNVILLTGYSAGCHSVRHLVGGGLDCYSTHKLGNVRHSLWQRITHFNEAHATFAWLSLFSVVITDVYIRLLQHGVLTDPHITF